MHLKVTWRPKSRLESKKDSSLRIPNLLIIVNWMLWKNGRIVINLSCNSIHFEYFQSPLKSISYNIIDLIHSPHIFTKSLKTFVCKKRANFSESGPNSMMIKEPSEPKEWHEERNLSPTLHLLLSSTYHQLVWRSVQQGTVLLHPSKIRKHIRQNVWVIAL